MIAATLSRYAGLALLASMLALVGCAHTPTPHYYVLAGAKGAGTDNVSDGPAIGLGPITLPDYLDRPQIVTRANDSRLVLSNEHRWAEPLAASLGRALLAELEHAAPGHNIALHPWRASLAITRQVRVDITRFDRDAGGSFHLGAHWSVSTPGSDQATPTRRSDIEVPVNGKDDDYDALLSAANAAVAQLASSIASQLQAR
jgi:uncharacterized lipoprotein YmbA